MWPGDRQDTGLNIYSTQGTWTENTEWTENTGNERQERKQDKPKKTLWSFAIISLSCTQPPSKLAELLRRTKQTKLPSTGFWRMLTLWVTLRLSYLGLHCVSVSLSCLLTLGRVASAPHVLWSRMPLPTVVCLYIASRIYLRKFAALGRLAWPRNTL